MTSKVGFHLNCFMSEALSAWYLSHKKVHTCQQLSLALMHLMSLKYNVIKEQEMSHCNAEILELEH